MSQSMPLFTLEAYRHLLISLKEAGYRFCSIAEMAAPVAGRTAYLRHDIDLHLNGVDRMAEVEAGEGVPACYYVLLTGCYNPFERRNLAVLRRLVAFGHEIGLHYDLTLYPADEGKAWARLRREVASLEEVVAAPVRTIVRHQPSLGGGDLFIQQDAYLHPHDPRYQDNMLYVSDSCRSWRDQSLLSCFSGGAPERLHLATHPEVWLNGAVTGARDYLEQVVLPNSVANQRDYLLNEVAGLWEARMASLNGKPKK